MGAVVPARPLLAVAVLALLAPPALAAEPADRPMGGVFSWSHELNQNELPSWNPRTAPPIAPRRWSRIVDDTLRTSGRNGLWFTGASALPFRVPLHPKEPRSWRNERNILALYRDTGLRWDVHVEIWAARRALRDRRTVIVNPQESRRAYTRRLSLLDPRYRAAALREIRRIVPSYRGKPYVHAYTGSDEPIIVLPRGARALRSAYARRMAAEVRRGYGWAPPSITAAPTSAPREGLRWLAYSRWSSDRFFAMKAEQAALIRRLDPQAVVVPNDFGFIDGFLPWDYTRLAGFADIVEADPYVSYGERDTPGRGRYNPGFTAKFLGDLTGRPVRIVIQNFPYSRYTPRPRDLYAWSNQALRAGAAHISFFASDNPRFTAKHRYEAMLDVAAKLRGTRLPGRPVDPAQLVVYATASEGQAQPHKSGGERYRTTGDELYTAHALLGELGHGAFSFEADTRLLREPARLDAARTIWLPRADTLDRAFAERLLSWVRGGGTLVVTDPEAFGRSPDGASLADVRAALIGAPLGAPRAGRVLLAEPGALGAGTPGELLELPIEAPTARAFASVPAGAGVVARFVDDAPAVITRPVGAGRVIAFATELLRPEALDDPLDLVAFVRAVHSLNGGTLDHPAWAYAIPGAPQASAPPWATAVTP
jgi:hypothetical protein